MHTEHTPCRKGGKKHVMGGLLEPCALIFDVQRFSVHDGPGIRTTVFFKGCPLRCRWCQNPESLRRSIEIAFFAERCRGTRGCARVCTRDALNWGDGDRIVRERCDACGRCADACAFGALQIVGRTVTLERLLAEVERDRRFYESSGGGVTLSGGEPTLQVDFVGAFVRQCYERNLAVGLQTCGAFAWEALAPFLRYLEFVHFDIKLIDPGEHRRMTGVGNETILRNARRLVSTGAPVEFRMPIVPGITDTERNLEQVARFLLDLGKPSLHLLRYHAMGEAKLPRLGYPIEPLGLAKEPAAEESIVQAAEVLAAKGLRVTR